jgi:hypothetical protein
MQRFLACLNHIFLHPGKLVVGRGGESHEKSFEELLRVYGVDYTRHPFGQRRTPDFSVGGRAVELKSCISDRVFLNDSFFRDDYLYILSAADTSVIAMGRDLYSPLELEKYECYHRELLELRRKYSSYERLRLYPRSATQFSVRGINRFDLFRKVKNELS